VSRSDAPAHADPPGFAIESSNGSIGAPTNRDARGGAEPDERREVFRMSVSYFRSDGRVEPG
jgi:hypothetical protein